MPCVQGSWMSVVTQQVGGPYDGTGPQVLLLAAGDGPVVSIGDRARVRQARDLGHAAGLSADTFAALDVDEVDLDPATGARQQLRRLGMLLRAVQVPAVAWTDPQGRIAGGVVGAALLDPDGVLVHGGASPVRAHVGAGAFLDVNGVPVHTWQNADGSGLPQLGVAAGTVVQVPATSVLADLLVNGEQIALAAATTGQVVRVRAVAAS